MAAALLFGLVVGLIVAIAVVSAIQFVQPGVDHAVRRQLKTISTRLGCLERKLVAIHEGQGTMTQQMDDIRAQQDRIKEAIAKVAADVKALAAKLAGGLSAEEAAEVKGELEALATSLEALDAETPDEPAAGGGTSEG